MKKTFVIDTNVLLQSPYAIYHFEDNDVVIPAVNAPDTAAGMAQVFGQHPATVLAALPLGFQRGGGALPQRQLGGWLRCVLAHGVSLSVKPGTVVV